MREVLLDIKNQLELNFLKDLVNTDFKALRYISFKQRELYDLADRLFTCNTFWDIVGEYQNLTENFMEKYLEKLLENSYFLMFQKLPQYLIDIIVEKYKFNYDYGYPIGGILLYQDLSEEFLIKNIEIVEDESGRDGKYYNSQRSRGVLCIENNENLNPEVKKRILNLIKVRRENNENG